MKNIARKLAQDDLNKMSIKLGTPVEIKGVNRRKLLYYSGENFVSEQLFEGFPEIYKVTIFEPQYILKIEEEKGETI